MNAEINLLDGVATLKIEGRVDTVTAKDLELKAKEVLDCECKKIIVDCSALSYVSSSGLRVFLLLQKGSTAKGLELVLKSISAPILEVFKITGFSSIFKIEE